ncbi:hypothetical protein GCM10027596_39720 [Nocardioides korecus]
MIMPAWDCPVVPDVLGLAEVAGEETWLVGCAVAEAAAGELAVAPQPVRVTRAMTAVAARAAADMGAGCMCASPGRGKGVSRPEVRTRST